MLPEHRFISEFGPRYDDSEYLKGIIERIPNARRKAACNGYSAKYLEQGRSSANTWIRKAVEKREKENWN